MECQGALVPCAFVGVLERFRANQKQAANKLLTQQAGYRVSECAYIHLILHR